MRLNRFIGDFDLSQKEIEISNSENIKQIRTVLRLEIGNKIILADGKGLSAEAAITSISKEKILVKIEKPASAQGSDVARQVSLYLAILKKENFELAVQKAVECGVLKIIPIITERTIKTGLNTTRLEKIILEACEQSGRSLVPTLSPILEFKDAVIEATGEKIIFHFVEQNYTPNKKADSASIFVGPEGGFTEKEIELAQNSGFTVASLGDLTLRGETAAVIGTYRAVHQI